MGWNEILLALGLVLIIEGVGPCLFPKKWQNFLRQITETPVSQLRVMGLVLVLLGWGIFYFNAS